MKPIYNLGRTTSEKTIQRVYENASLGRDTIQRGYVYRLTVEPGEYNENTDGKGWHYNWSEVIWRCKQGDEDREFIDSEGSTTNLWEKVYEKEI